MSKTEMLRARIEPDLKRDAEIIFSKLGLSTTQAVTLFYKQVVINHGLPFDVKLPNPLTQEALHEVMAKKDLKKYGSVNEVKEKLS